MTLALIQTVFRFAWRLIRTATGRAAAVLLGGGILLLAQSAEKAAQKDLTPVRFAFSSQMFTDVNENDARASVKAWALALARERGVPMSTEPIVLSGTTQLREFLCDASIDGAAVTTEEYLSLEPELQGTNMFVSFIGGQYTEVYLMLVRVDSGITDLGGLRGRKITLFENPRMSLAPLWLDLTLSEQGLGPPARHFGQVVRAQKLPKVVLPVFFRQQDACIVTRRGFETMCELNPQVRAQLRVLVTSPAVVPAVGFLRRGYDSPLRDMMLNALRGLEKSAAGEQVLTLFQSDQLQEVSATLLGSARDLVEAHRRLNLTGVVETNLPVAAAANLELRRAP